MWPPNGTWWGNFLINGRMCTRLGSKAASDLWTALGRVGGAPPPRRHPFSCFLPSGSCPVLGWAQLREEKLPAKAGGSQKMVLSSFVPWAAEGTWCNLPSHCHGDRQSPCLFALVLSTFVSVTLRRQLAFSKEGTALKLCLFRFFPNGLISNTWNLDLLRSQQIVGNVTF